ncbi:MAG: glycosyltransferase, partial [Anaerolineae bacterium]
MPDVSERPRVLFLTSELPYPPHQGMAIRAYNLIAGLRERFRVDLYSLSSSPDAAQHTAALRQVCERVEVLPAPTRTRAQRLRALLTTRLPDMALRAHSPAFQQAVLRALAEGDYAILHVESIEMAPYALAALEAGLPRRPRIVFDDLNAEYLLQKRAFETDLRHPRRWIGAAYSFVQWRRLARYERRMCRLADCVVAVSEWDRDALARLASGADIRVVPNGIDAGHYLNYSPGGEDPTAGTPGPKLVFTGKMDFRPNVDAACWFADAILPRIRANVPDAHLYIVGQRPSPAVQALGGRPGITVTGFVPDVRPYIAAADVYVVPMRMGGGTRLKVLEAMTLGKAIVSTSLGCEGYGLTPGRELVVADDAERFADETVALLRDRARRAQLGALARE